MILNLTFITRVLKTRLKFGNGVYSEFAGNSETTQEI